MRFIVFMKGDFTQQEVDQTPAEAYEAMTAYNERLLEAGVLKGGEGLLPSATGKRLAFSGAPGSDPRIIDGPFAGSEELVAGFWLWQCQDWDEAISWARQCPAVGGAAFEIEVRQIAEADDHGEGYTDELRAKEDAMRARLEG